MYGADDPAPAELTADLGDLGDTLLRSVLAYIAFITSFITSYK